jgi:hypothetical protein
MKKYLSLLFTGLIVLSMYVTPGTTVKAAETNVVIAATGDCSCHDVTPILGAERNKMVSDLLKSEAFKNLKMELKEEGYTWYGAQGIEVIKINVNGMILIGVPFTNDQQTVMAAFNNGVLLGITPM